MNVRVLLVFLWPSVVAAQGFAGLGTTVEGYDDPVPDPVFDFPADHGAHPGYRIEWWYVTANLTAEDGRDMGLQWTLFRTALAPGGDAAAQVWMGHAAVTTAEAHFAVERFSRGDVPTAGVTAAPLKAFIDDWAMAGETLDEVRLTASAPEFAYDVTLRAEGPLILHGEGGYSVKSDEGQASYYYSQPFYAVEGVLSLPGEDVAVTGSAWLDREWSSQPLSETQEGWDWFSLSFEGGDKLMGFRLREGGEEGYTYATWIGAGGEELVPYARAFEAEALERATVAGRQVPVRWRVRLPERGVDVEVTALNPEAWMGLSFPYWEGPVRVTGSHEGRGYLEMTGYE
ncbi:lipocalin-like domain-containing protein [Histidinibacterium lentulum]|uniref:Iron ABC transporter permease n=1 Tax=Histidinibacterium lentulum TaxID=2480588 RepID=A0A3N2R1M1_9RHOB|nr:lipocalin-like domain-containing protein [Histidinibacterium lentulum]ROU01216.1 iron ABC transporter permease [Histidinibacterium lentulum]